MKNTQTTKTMALSLLTAAFLTVISTASFADEGETVHTNDRWEECAMDINPNLTQSEWKQFNKNFSSILYFKPMSGAKPMGKGKIDISLEMSRTKIDEHSGAWKNTFSHPEDDHFLSDDDHQLQIPVLTARYGVTNDIDAGVTYTKNPESNYSWMGMDAKYAFHQDKRRGISIATRLSSVVIMGVEDFDYYLAAADLLVSKELGMFTPYAGVTGIVSSANETTDEVDLERNTLASVEAIVGTQFQWSYLSVAAETDIARVNTYSVKVGAIF